MKKRLRPCTENLQRIKEARVLWGSHGCAFLPPSPVLEGVQLSWVLSRPVRKRAGDEYTLADLKGALNFPDHRGTATAFPLSAFGLSAFFFSLISSLAFPSNTEDLLLLLSIVTLMLPLIGGAFLRVYPDPYNYHPIPKREASAESGSLRLKRSKSEESKHGKRFDEQIGTPTDDTREGREEEALSLLSSPEPEEDPCHMIENEEQDSPQPDIRGFAMLKHVKFYQLFLLLGLFTGIGLMTIKCDLVPLIC